MQNHALPIDCDHVETNAGVRSYDLYVIGCEPAKVLAFTGVHGCKCASVPAGPACLHLDEDYRFPVTSDEVDFAAGKSQVSADYAVAGSL